jgi:hypothetical protein
MVKARWVWLGAACVICACSADGDRSGDDTNTNTPGGPTGSGSGGRGGAAGRADFGNSNSPPPVAPPMTEMDSGAPPGGECGAVTQMAQNMLQPVDIIFGIDTSGSMAEEIGFIQENMNAFSQRIIESGIDVHVILLAENQGQAMPPITVEGVCIGAPLGSGTCPADTNPPVYTHINTAVSSWDVLDVYINAYPTYRDQLRENSLKTFVTVSDDNADNLLLPPTINNAEAFVAAVAALEPNSAMWSNWRYSGIYCFSMCPASFAVGTVHADLVSRTMGVGGDLCLQDFGPVFDELAKVVAETVTLSCDWEIPPPPSGETFDKTKANVRIALDGSMEMLAKAPDAAGCADKEGWYYDDEDAPRRVVACPATCTRIQAAQNAQVDLLFGCETIVIPID